MEEKRAKTEVLFSETWGKKRQMEKRTLKKE